MTRTVFYDARLAHWKSHIEASDYGALDAESQALRDVEAAQAAGVTWDPEKPNLPKRIALGIRDDGRPSLLAVDGAGFAERPIYDAAITAYNREHDDCCKWPSCTLLGLCQSGNFGNRLVCAEHFNITNGPPGDGPGTPTARLAFILSELEKRFPDAHNWWSSHAPEPAYLTAIDALLKTAPTWTGADDSPDPEPAEPKHWLGPDGRNCALCGKPWPHAHTPEQLAVWEAKGGAKGDESSREWPERIGWYREKEKIFAFVEPSTLRPGGWRFLSREEAEEAARRWQEEPRLRMEVEGLRRRINLSSDILEHVQNRRHIEPTGDLLDKVLRALRILTGKES